MKLSEVLRPVVRFEEVRVIDAIGLERSETGRVEFEGGLSLEFIKEQKDPSSEGLFETAEFLELKNSRVEFTNYLDSLGE